MAIVFGWLYWIGFILYIPWLINGINTRTARYEEDKNQYSALPLQLDCFTNIIVPQEPIDTLFRRDIERTVLLQIYTSTSQAQNWTISHGWSSLSWNTSVDQCDLPGVTCKSGYVIGLSLNKNNLSGQMPNTIWKLRNLRVLCLPSNSLQGHLKDFIFPNMTKLLRIDCAFCSLTGTIPEYFFSKLISLQKIQLSGQTSVSRLEGVLHESISNLTDLQVLSLAQNKFFGPIPRSVGKLKKLWFLDLEFMSSISGDIHWLLGLKSLRFMHLSNCGIYGELPDDLGSYFPDLMELQLPQNPGLSGSKIPSSIDQMKNLNKIVLHNNGLQGIVPKALGNLSQLMILDLSSNQLKGLDSELSFKGSPKLEILLLGNNKELTANIQNLVTALIPTTGLRILNISQCNFKGSIDAQLWDLVNLIELDLKGNKLKGTLPEVHNDLLFLTNLDLSGNDFEGAIPNCFQLLQALMWIDIRGNLKMRSPKSEVNITSGRIQHFMHANENFRHAHSNFSCPFGRIISTNGSVLFDPDYYDFVFCLCGQGFYGRSIKCKKCMTNGNCSGAGSFQLLKNESVQQIVMTINRGFYPSPTPGNVSHLIECPRLPREEKLACNPNGDCKCWVNETSLATVCDETCTCLPGSTDWLCSKCISGYYKSRSLCIKCDNDAKFSLYSLIPVIVIILIAIWGVTHFCNESTKARFILAASEFIFLIILKLAKVIAGWFLEVALIILLFNVIGISKGTRGVISICVFYIQVLDAMVSSNSTPLPTFVINVQYYMSSVMNLDFTGISCEIPLLFTPIGNYLLIFLFPMACLMLIWMFYAFKWLVIKKLQRGDNINQRQQDILSNCKKLSITCLCLTYFPVSRQTIALLAPCAHDGHHRYLRIAPWIQCSEKDDTYLTLQLLGWLGVVIYIVTVPVLLQSLLFCYQRNKHKFNEEKRKTWDAWLGAIYLPYTENVQCYFEVLKLLRKLLIAVFLAVFSDTSFVQTISVSMVLFLSLIYHLKYEPYKIDRDGGNSFENFLEFLTLSVLHLSFIMVRFGSYDLESGISIIWIVIIMNVGVIVAFSTAIISTVINTCCNKPDNDEQKPLLGNNQ